MVELEFDSKQFDSRAYTRTFSPLRYIKPPILLLYSVEKNDV